MQSPSKTEASKRDRKLLRRYYRGSMYRIRAKDIQRWIENGWIEYVEQRGECSYATSQVLSATGIKAAGLKD